MACLLYTSHSGSGKSTVIDAMQILLYANTDGRGFFNKAAADDSDRTLIEYLRGMVNICLLYTSIKLFLINDLLYCF